MTVFLKIGMQSYVWPNMHLRGPTDEIIGRSEGRPPFYRLLGSKRRFLNRTRVKIECRLNDNV